MNLGTTKRPSEAEAKNKSIFSYKEYQDVLDSCICKIVC
ncbi:hypothetical protein SAMN04487886_10563 [Clostridium sp. DSM 8431]|nr:hypothetical protein SAMN04487886_10563 [Clostridium sp. DSM 8431]